MYGFFPAPGTNYKMGDEPEIARRLNELAKAHRLHIIGISGYRSAAHSVAVGGFSDDPHTRGEASDSPGVESVPESVLNEYGLTRPFPGAAEADHIQLAKSSTSQTGVSLPGASTAAKAGCAPTVIGILTSVILLWRLKDHG